MPTYVYACDACGKQFEQFQSFKDEPLRTCLCGQEGHVRRVFQPVGIVFKGSGWYITDSRKSDSANIGMGDSSPKTETSESKTTEATESKTTETKPTSEPTSQAKTSETKPSTD